MNVFSCSSNNFPLVTLKEEIFTVRNFREIFAFRGNKTLDPNSRNSRKFLTAKVCLFINYYLINNIKDHRLFRKF